MKRLTLVAVFVALLIAALTATSERMVIGKGVIAKGRIVRKACLTGGCNDSGYVVKRRWKF